MKTISKITALSLALVMAGTIMAGCGQSVKNIDTAATEAVSQSSAMTTEERIEKHRKMAMSYYNAYQNKSVSDGETYDEWKFSDDAVYWSPYFGNNLIDLSVTPMSVQQSATMEALSYSATFPDWGPLEFECWPSPDGFAMKTLFGGHDKDGKLMTFHAYGFVKTNENCEITRWETHVSPEYNDFLDAAIGVHGPFKNGPEPYMEAVAKKLAEAGIELPHNN